MAFPLVIAGQTINFPSSADDPNWAPALIQFASVVASALQGVAGAYDVPPQIFTLDPYNPGTNISLPLLNFPVSNVRSVIVYYSILRTTSLVTVGDAGQLQLLYNPTNPVGSKWEIVRVGTEDGGAGVTFSITDSGQVQFTTNTLSGINHVGRISFSARALTFV